MNIKKLISAYIATIIILIITIGIGVVLYLYFSGYISQLTSETEETAIKSIIECSKAKIDGYAYKEFKYRIPITITERSGNTLTDYQVLVVINTQELISQGKMRSDCGDIRFTDSDGITLLNYWIESGCNSANTRIWVKVPNIPANSNKIIYLYYGNPYATSMSNGDLVFEFFDDFEGTSLDTSKWTTTGYGGYGGIYYSVSDGILTIWSDNNWRILRMNKNFAPKDKVVVEVKFLKTADSSWHTNYLVQYDNVNNNRIGLLDLHYTGADMGIQLAVSGIYSYPKNFGPFSSNVWYISRIIKLNETTLTVDAYTSDRILINSYTTTQTAWSTITWTWVCWQRENVQVKYDWIFVRKYASPEPTVSLGSEETSPIIKLTMINLGIELGKRYLIKLIYEDGKIAVRNITLDKNLSSGESKEIYLTDLPKGIIKKIEIYSIDVCPNMLVGIRSVNIEV